MVKEDCVSSKNERMQFEKQQELDRWQPWAGRFT